MFANTHFFIKTIRKIDATTRCKMLEVKNNQLFACVENHFSTDLFHRFCGKLYEKKTRKISAKVKVKSR